MFYQIILLSVLRNFLLDKFLVRVECRFDTFLTMEDYSITQNEFNHDFFPSNQIFFPLEEDLLAKENLQQYIVSSF